MTGFRFERIQTNGAVIHTAVAGEGPPLLLLHGNPLTLVHFHRIGPALARDFTVVATDLRGYGDSSKPAGGGDHADYSFRVMSEDNIAVMRHLGFDRFAVAGHDRGGCVAIRMALDHPDIVTMLATLDIVPLHHMFTQVSLGWALESYHWSFMTQDEPFPEKLLSSDIPFYMQYKLNKKGVGTGIFHPDAMAEYLRCATPEQIHGVCEDYRASLSIDLPMDRADFGKKHIQCPVLSAWGTLGHVGRNFPQEEAWRPWVQDFRHRPVPAGHYLAEHRPDIIHPMFLDFFQGREPAEAAA